MNTILIADDEESLRLLIRTTLDSPDYSLMEAPDGITALEMARPRDAGPGDPGLDDAGQDRD
jgi:CheY-like chemotaxis protein